jgi:hypothetical protein
LNLLMNALLYLVFFGLTALASGMGAYFGSYLKKKGENLATHEDINKLLAQVSAVTQTTKEIEAKISDDVWSRQKHWEMKRDVIFDVSRKIARVDEILPSLFVGWKTKPDAQNDTQNVDDRIHLEQRAKAATGYNEAANELDQVATLVTLVCAVETRLSVYMFSSYTRRVARDIVNENLSVFDTEGLLRQRENVMIALRKEIGILPA